MELFDGIGEYSSIVRKNIGITSWLSIPTNQLDYLKHEYVIAIGYSQLVDFLITSETFRTSSWGEPASENWKDESGK